MVRVRVRVKVFLERVYPCRTYVVVVVQVMFIVHMLIL